MHMQLTTNSALVWKRRADESEQSAKMLTRVSVVLLLLMVVIGGYAYSSHSQYSEMCASIQQKAAATDSLPARKLGLDVVSAYCR